MDWSIRRSAIRSEASPGFCQGNMRSSQFAAARCSGRLRGRKHWARLRSPGGARGYVWAARLRAQGASRRVRALLRFRHGRTWIRGRGFPARQGPRAKARSALRLGAWPNLDSDRGLHARQGPMRAKARSAILAPGSARGTKARPMFRGREGGRYRRPRSATEARVARSRGLRARRGAGVPNRPIHYSTNHCAVMIAEIPAASSFPRTPAACSRVSNGPMRTR